MAIALVLIGVYNCKKFSFSDEVKTKSYSGVKNLTSGCSKIKASSNSFLLKLKGISDSKGSTPTEILFLLDLNDEKSKMKFNNESLQQDMTLYKIPYDENFWNSVSLPPETKFYLKNIKELEGLYGVPIQTQFLYSNKR